MQDKCYFLANLHLIHLVRAFVMLALPQPCSTRAIWTNDQPMSNPVLILAICMSIG